MRQRLRIVIPLCEVADGRAYVLRSVEPLHAAPPLRPIRDVARNDDHRRLVAIGVINRHGRMLDPNRPVCRGEHRLALDLGVAVGHRHRGFLVHARNEFRLIVAVIDERFVESAEARAGIREEILDP